jgi:FkbM family methyltransferase
LSSLLDRPSESWLSDLRDRYPEVDDIVAGRRPAVLYPAARMARHAARRLRSVGVDIVGFADRDRRLHGTTIDGLNVYAPAELATVHPDVAICIASTLHDSAISESLAAIGLQRTVPVGYLAMRLPDAFVSREYGGAWDAVVDPHNRSAIEAAYGLLADRESRRVFAAKLEFYLSIDKSLLDGIRSKASIYFDQDLYRLIHDEVVVDGGAFTGDTLASFLTASDGRYQSYYGFEPDPMNFERLEAAASVDQLRVTAIRAGLGSQGSTAQIVTTGGPDARLMSNDGSGSESVDVVALDQFFDGRPPPTLIKLDVEGAERETLAGASGILQDTAPILAVSAYHFPQDLWEIPLLIAGLTPASGLYLRHYTREVDDTVCYAIPPDRQVTGSAFAGA